MATHQIRRYQQIVDRFDEVARANLGSRLQISKVCRAGGFTVRTLSRAVRAVTGTTPARYVRDLRLRTARQLLSSRTEVQSVGKVARQVGLLEPGRFAIWYRDAFGELPSDTLRRARSHVEIPSVEETPR